MGYLITRTLRDSRAVYEAWEPATKDHSHIGPDEKGGYGLVGTDQTPTNPRRSIVAAKLAHDLIVGAFPEARLGDVRGVRIWGDATAIPDHPTRRWIAELLRGVSRWLAALAKRVDVNLDATIVVKD